MHYRNRPAPSSVDVSPTAQLRNLLQLRVALFLVGCFGFSLPLISDAANDPMLDAFERLKQRAEKIDTTQRAAPAKRVEVPVAAPEPEPVRVSEPPPQSQFTPLTVEPVVVAEPAPEKKEKEKEKDALKISGRLQVDYRQQKMSLSTAPDTTETTNNKIFDIRRARVDVRGSLQPNIKHKVSIEMSNKVKMKDAYIDYAFDKNLHLQAGQFSYPYSSENTSSSRYYEFIEPAIMSESLSASRDRGLALLGNILDKQFFYTVSIVDGTGSTKPDRNKSLDYIARFQALPLTSEGDGLKIWLGGTYATGHRDSSEEESVAVAPETESGFTLFEATMPTDQAYDRTKIAFDVKAVFGPAFFGAEYLEGDYAVENKVAITGGYVVASYFLTGEQRTIEEGFLERQSIKNPYGSGGWGAWEIAVRYSWFKTDSLFFEPDGLYTGWTALDGASNAGAGKAWTIGVNWYPAKMVRLMANYVRTSAETGTINADTDLYETFATEDTFLIRYQVEF